VVFDSASNATDYTVTFGAGAVCANWTVAGPTSGSVTFAGTDGVSVHGSLLWPATGMVKSYTGTTTLAATTTGKTVTTNGLNAGNITFNGVGGGWSLGGALTASVVTVTNGSFSTSVSNYAVTTVEFLSNNSNTRTVNFNGSTITCTRSGTLPTAAFDFTDPTGLTFSAGTSQITLSGTNANFVGGGQTFYNASFTNASGTFVEEISTVSPDTYNILLPKRFKDLVVAGAKKRILWPSIGEDGNNQYSVESNKYKSELLPNHFVFGNNQI
jgi:hypothetical protein